MQVKNILMDMELDKTVNELMDNVVANNSAAKEHVYQIEWCILTVKEWSRAFFNALPFDYLPKIIGVNLV